MKSTVVLLMATLLFMAIIPSQATQNDTSMQLATNSPAMDATASGHTLRSLADKRNFYMGAAVAVGPLLASSDYSSTLSQQYNMVVAENVMKWYATEPLQGTFSFSQADQIVDFAEANHMAVRGHNLVWHNQLPGWLTSGTFTYDELLAILQKHIEGIVTHYKGRILDWDVVNEGVADDGSLRSDLWLKGLGPDYIAQAFRFAHAADPKAKLFYNDYNGEGNSRKADAIYELVKGLKSKGVPIDGVGLQMHVGIGTYQAPAVADVAANMDRLAALGLEVQITEMDVKIQNGSGTPDENRAAQARVYGDMLQVCLQHKACTALVTWGFTDQYSWIPTFTKKDDAPLPFDKAYQPKPAFMALLNSLTGA